MTALFIVSPARADYREKSGAPRAEFREQPHAQETPESHETHPTHETRQTQEVHAPAAHVHAQAPAPHATLAAVHNSAESHQKNFNARARQRYVGMRRHHLQSYRRIRYLDRDYFFDDGFFYMDQPGGYYVIVQPPIGAVLPLFPAGAAQIIAGNQVYFVYQNTYYLQVPGGYQVVQRPAYL